MSGLYCQPCDVYEEYMKCNRRIEPTAARPLTNPHYRSYDEISPCNHRQVQRATWDSSYVHENPDYRLEDSYYYRRVPMKIVETPTKPNRQPVLKQCFKDKMLLRNSEENCISTGTCYRVTSYENTANYIRAKVEVSSSCCSLTKERSCNTPQDSESAVCEEESQLKCSIKIKRHSSDTGTQRRCHNSTQSVVQGRQSSDVYQNDESIILKPRRTDTSESFSRYGKNYTSNADEECDGSSIVDGIINFLGNIIRSPIIEEVKQAAFGKSCYKKSEELKGKRDCTNEDETKVIWSPHSKHDHYLRKRKRPHNDRIKTVDMVYYRPLMLALFFITLYLLDSFVKSL